MRLYVAEEKPRNRSRVICSLPKRGSMSSKLVVVNFLALLRQPVQRSSQSRAVKHERPAV